MNEALKAQLATAVADAVALRSTAPLECIAHSLLLAADPASDAYQQTDSEYVLQHQLKSSLEAVVSSVSELNAASIGAGLLAEAKRRKHLHAETGTKHGGVGPNMGASDQCFSTSSRMRVPLPPPQARATAASRSCRGRRSADHKGQTDAPHSASSPCSSSETGDTKEIHAGSPGRGVSSPVHGTTVWAVGDWLGSTGSVVRALAQSLLNSNRAAEQSELEFVRALGAKYKGDPITGRANVLALLQRGAAIEAVAASLWADIEQLMEVGAATDEELQAKFLQEGASLLSYSGLNTFFGGLARKLGDPDPNVDDALVREHTGLGDAHGALYASNYEMETTSATEWAFVATPDSPPSGGWPIEQKLVRAHKPAPKLERSRTLTQLVRSGARMRVPMPLADLMALMDDKNLKLKELEEPPLRLAEAKAARLYTGPLFVKYNAVLRGLDSEVVFLKNSMIELCCSKEVSDKYMGGAQRGEEPKGTLQEGEVRKHLNTYTTTLHVINSAIVKLSKLTVATKVYRGISGRVLPKEFWEPNGFGVKGGIESAFMSTTLDEEVALSYAAGAAGTGFVFEIQQGMVDRGADIGFLSQYPHEQEILFAPLTGMEVRSTRVVGAVLVVSIAISINLASQTIEQVVGKRRDLIDQMSNQIADQVGQQLRDKGIETQAITKCIDGFQDRVKDYRKDKPPEWYNDDGNLKAAVDNVVSTKAQNLLAALTEKTQQEKTGLELHGKFAASAEKFGDATMFFAGLEGLLGSPSPEVMPTMTLEHASEESFKAWNAGVERTTTPKAEWEYVTKGTAGTSLRMVDVRVGGQRDAGAHAGWKLEDFATQPEIKKAGLLLAEVAAVRSYTGPMYVHYNSTLHNGTKGAYVTTLHAINSGIIKLSKQTKPCTVYRGVAGGVLPERFWSPDEHGVTGGIELGVMSTTTEREVALHHTQQGGAKAKMVFEIRMGMIDRGAVPFAPSNPESGQSSSTFLRDARAVAHAAQDVSMLSQFPAEKEILFSPLTGLEAGSMRMEGDVFVVEVRLSCNVQDLPIEEVIGKMQTGHKSMVQDMLNEFQHCTSADKVLQPLTAVLEAAMLRGYAFFTVPGLFRRATDEALKAREAAFDALGDEETWEVAEGNKEDVAAQMRRGAELCARHDKHQAAARLLTMAVQRCPVSHEDKAVVERICREREHTATNAQRAALEAARLLMKSGDCRRAPWPPILRALGRAGDGDSRKGAAAFLAMASGLPTTVVTARDFDEDATAEAVKGSAVLVAADAGDDRAVEAALERGPDANATTENDVTALMLAARAGACGAVRALLAKGADATLRSRKGSTALFLAAEAGAVDCARLLIGGGAEVDAAVGERELTPLLQAAGGGYLGVVEVLLANGAQVDKTRTDGVSALMLAAQGGHEDVVKVLLEYGASVNRTRGNGGTALNSAIFFKMEGVVEMLRSAGALTKDELAAEEEAIAEEAIRSAVQRAFQAAAEEAARADKSP